MLSQFTRSMSIFLIAARMLGGYLWFRFLERFRSDEVEQRARTALYRHWGRLLRDAAVRLEGLIIKVGQFLSTRTDVLPPVFTREVAQLQDEVPGDDPASIREQVEAELEAPIEEVFRHFEPEALAAASLGQVHTAVLMDGRNVAVKVLRPGIERIVATDLAALRKVAWFLMRFTDWAKGMDLPALLDEFEKIVGEEMDYIREAENLRTFRRNLGLPPSGPNDVEEAGHPKRGGGSDNRDRANPTGEGGQGDTAADTDEAVGGIHVPYPIEPWITRRVLVMQFVEGIKPTDRAALAAAGIDGSHVARILVTNYIKQVLVDGFVHADPHPGNIYVHPDETVVLMDFGMTVTITNEDRAGLNDLVKGLMLGDLNRAINALRTVGVLSLTADAEVLKQALQFLLDRLQGVRIRPGPDFEAFLDEFRDWLYEEPLQFPSRFMFLGRAAGLLAGVVSSLDPEFNWIEVLKDEALPLLGKQTGPQGGRGAGEGPTERWREVLEQLLGPQVAGAVGPVAEEAMEVGKTLVRLPGRLDRTLEQIESDSLRVQVDLQPVVEQLQRQSLLMARLVWAILAGGAGLCAVLLGINGFAAPAWILGGASGLFLVFLLAGVFGRSRRSGHRHFHHWD